MSDEKNLKGWRIWEIDEKTKVPKEIECNEQVKGTMKFSDLTKDLDLDVENKTYAIRIGKKGLQWLD